MWRFLQDFVTLWSDIIKAVTTVEGMVALLILAVIVFALITKVRSPTAPWYAVPVLLALMILGALGLIGVTAKGRSPVREPISEITAGYGAPGDPSAHRKEFTDYVRSQCDRKMSCTIQVNHTSLGLSDPAERVSKVTEVDYRCGPYRRKVFLLESRAGELWCD
jgi:hypothetical protein